MVGETVLHYRILEKLGEGGMGVVYLAEDTTLGRTVALKFLPERAAGSEQDKLRFLQEARAAATLNHPNICTIHAVEESAGRTFIAMERVEGATLRSKLPLRPLTAACDAGIQIGEALAEAHAKGIVHRDVKSENIMITPKGQVKVMDFGLAKLKGSMKLTRTSSTVGTLGYMSPEQIQGGEADHRSDIFSLGVVLFEMVTGHLPFRGDHEAAMVYSIVNEPPRPVGEFTPDAPPGLADLFAKIFEKDPSERYQSAADVAADLRRIRKHFSGARRREPMVAGGAGTAAQEGGVAAGQGGRSTGRGGDSYAPDSVGRPGASRASVVVLASLLVLALGVLAYREFLAPAEEEAPRYSFSRITDQAGEELFPDISPDGNYVAFVRGQRDLFDVHVQRIGGGNPVNLTAGSGTRNYHPAHSPGGDMIAFRSERDGGGIFLMGSTGESVRRLTDFGYNPSWSPDGKSIVVATEEIWHPFARNTESSLHVIDAATGKVERIFEGDGVQPRWSPDGSRIAFWGLPIGTGDRELWTIAPSGGTPVRITHDDHLDWYPEWSPDGRHLYFLSNRGGTMNVWRIAIDPATGAAAGDPEPITVPSQNCTALRLSVVGGKIVYASSDVRGNIHRIPFDAGRRRLSGPPEPVTDGSREVDYLKVSPDGSRIAFTVQGTQEDLGIIGTDGRGFRRITNDRAKDRGPAWSPDGRRIAFYSSRSGRYQIWIINADGSGIRQITHEKTASTVSWPLWLPGTNLIYYQRDTSGAFIAEDGNPASHALLPPLPGAHQFSGTSISPDGKTLAGHSVQADGRNRGLVLYRLADSSFTRIHESGEHPLWLLDGRTLLFLEDGIMALFDVPSGSVTLLEGAPYLEGESMFALAPDNRFIYFVKSESETDVWVGQVP